MRVSLFVVLLAGCAQARGAPEDVCGAAKLGLAGAVAATNFTLPDGCMLRGLDDVVVFVHSAKEFAAHFTCIGPGSSTPTVDFSKSTLVVKKWILSPAAAGTDVYDDGKIVTLVNRFATPCPSQFPPIPTPHTLAGLLPARAGTRTVRELSCTLPPSCR